MVKQGMVAILGFLPFFHLHMSNSQQGPWWGQSSRQGPLMKSDIQISPKAWRATDKLYLINMIKKKKNWKKDFNNAESRVVPRSSDY